MPGVPTADLRDALVNAWKNDYPELAISTVTLDGMEVTKGDFGEDAIDSYWYEKDGLAVRRRDLGRGHRDHDPRGHPRRLVPDELGGPVGLRPAPSAPAASPSPS